MTPVYTHDHTCKPECLVCKGEQRAAQARQDAAAWHYVTRAWDTQKEKPRTPRPERWPWANHPTLAEWQAVRLSKLDGNLSQAPPY